MRRPSALAGSGNQKVRKHKPDYWLLIMSLVLMVIGLIVVYAISPSLSAQRNVNENYFVSKQVIAIFIGLGAFFIAANIPTIRWKNWTGILVILSIMASLAVVLFGEKVNGAYRWIQIGGLSFQAVELIKLTLLVWLAAFFTDRIAKGTLTNSNVTFKPLLIVIVVIALVVANPKLQSDLGSTAVLISMVAVMSFVARMPMRRVLSIAALVIIGTTLLIATSAYRRDRIQTFLQPERDCQAAGYQACQALITVGTGGMFGKGLAHSVQAYGYLPEAANDSIFAIYSEKFGFLGSVALLLIYVTLFTRLKNVMERAPDNFSRFLMVGILTWLSTQAFINIGAMIGLLPLKGITLPFISYGGTSIIFVSVAMGIAFNISRYTTYGPNINLDTEGQNEDNSQRRRDWRTYNANNRRSA